ncbi:hypothetical protein OJF2_42670 [Aquisphaera giovannonii]|uniref:PEP-CTERM protein-sorting domain-containing protein n=1 Tax=Aquisphaera giovannonii TaxID=406548 RepID=A0A5B9W703_9BACT|nr:choice-of-anchor R domain-containing protein [Aquisphaera giovannonii]QEH35710.1 hypothetical protein OJF2_42670 [Aquisphaera giovannonii]
MTDIQRSARHGLVVLVVLGGWALRMGPQAAHAGVVVSTLGLPNDDTFPGEQVGAAIQIGSTPIDIESVVYSQARFSGPAPGETFAIFSRNADGTVGSSLFDAFALTYDSAGGNTTATATSPFTLQANTSYWLMMVETPGTFGDWDNSLSFTYTNNFDVTIPDSNASVSLVPGEGYLYANANEGLQLFQLNGSPAIAVVAEPSALALATTGGTLVLGAFWHRRGREK